MQSHINYIAVNDAPSWDILITIHHIDIIDYTFYMTVFKLAGEKKYQISMVDHLDSCSLAI